MSDIWLEKLEREIKLRNAVLLVGNVDDLILNGMMGGQYSTVAKCVADLVFNSGYTKVISWNRAEGGKTLQRGGKMTIGVPTDTDESDEGSEYDMGSGNFDNEPKTYAKPEEFFPYLRTLLAKPENNTAVIVDYSDYLFGDGRSLSDDERKNITNLMIAIERDKNDGAKFFEHQGNLLILIAKTTEMLPPAIYVNNPFVATVTVPLPGRGEREKFVKSKETMLSNLKPSLTENGVMANFIDALDGFTLRNIAQLIKLSSASSDKMNFEKLINLYRYGEKISPWEELSYDKLKTVEETLLRRVKGQSEAVKKVRDVIIRAYTGFSGLQHSAKQKKPKGALFFVGPTGVGKTELAKSLAEFVFGDETAYRRFDMSEYAHEQSDQRLVGAPPGYVGYEKGGELTNAVKEKPFCVLLFDEIEKAHGRIMDKFLQILEDGRLTDGKGETVYFSETFIIFTSNIGASEADINFTAEQTKSHFVKAVKKHFVEELKRPEILNRLGDANIVPFNFIREDEVLTSIGIAKFAPIKNFVKERYNVDIRFEDEQEIFSALAKIVNKANGGRGMLNAMEEKLINPLSEFVFENINRLKGRTLRISPEKNHEGKILDFDFKLD